MKGEKFLCMIEGITKTKTKLKKGGLCHVQLSITSSKNSRTF